MNTITNKIIDGRIATFSTNRDALRNEAQEIAMLIFYHAAPKAVSADCNGHGDVSRAIKLVKAMPTSWGEQMKTWFEKYTPIRMKVSSARCELDPAYKALSVKDKPSAWLIEEALATPFWEASVERPVKEYDFPALLKMIEQTGSRIQKKIEAGEVKADDVASAWAIVTAISGLKVERVKVEAAANDTNTEEPKKNTARAPRVRKAA